MPTTYYLKATAYEPVQDASAFLRLFDGARCVGRWYACGGLAFCLCEAESHEALQAVCTAAADVASVVVRPVVDDAQLREIVGEKTEKRTEREEMTEKTDESDADDDVYVIEYAFQDGVRVEGYESLAHTTAEEERDECGPDLRILQRWHDLGTGTGVIVCTCPFAVDVQRWAFRWAGMSDWTIHPVVAAETEKKVDDLPLPSSSSKRGWFF
jgi:hypothetical protein